MKPITNILLALALVSYVFLPFYNLSLQDTVTGFGFTAGTFTQAFTLRRMAFALIPFVAGFLAIAFNSLKRRWGIIASMACIVVFIAFLLRANAPHEIALSHAPDVVAPTDMTEGLQIVGVGMGYVTCFGLLIAALLSAIVSLMPLAINRTIEQAVDNTIEEGRRRIHDLETNAKDELGRLGGKNTQQPPRQDDSAGSGSNIDNEDPSRFMPRQ